VLSKISVRNFKSYRHAVLPLSSLTVLIGANASGKSNVLEAIRLLSWIAQGNRLNSIKYAVYEGDQAVRGTVESLARNDATEFTISATLNNKDWDKFSISLKIKNDKDLHIANEKILGLESTSPLYEVVGSSGANGSDLRVAYNNFARGGKKPQLICNDQLAIMHQLQSSARFDSGHRKAQLTIPKTCRQFQETLSNIFFLDPQPRLMRSYSFKGEKTLKGDGANISGILFSLCADKKKKNDLLNFIHALPEQNISDISFIETPRSEVMVELHETFGGVDRSFDATLLSDGTLRVLSIAAAVMSAPENSLVVIEELDNGIHPSRAQMMLQNIANIAHSRGIQILISSHNPALLDSLPDAAVPDVVFCYRDFSDGTSCLVRLGSAPEYPRLIAQGPIGHLMTKGLLDRFIRSQPDTVQKRKLAEEWLSQLNAEVEK
jgi:predicted ATPase